MPSPYSETRLVTVNKASQPMEPGSAGLLYAYSNHENIASWMNGLRTDADAISSDVEIFSFLRRSESHPRKGINYT